jgi:hypothetical protein
LISHERKPDDRHSPPSVKEYTLAESKALAEVCRISGKLSDPLTQFLGFGGFHMKLSGLRRLGIFPPVVHI